MVINDCTYKLFTSVPSQIEVKQVPWSSVTGIDIRDRQIRIMGPQGQWDGGHAISEKWLKEQIAKQQLKGVIPARVTVLTPEGAGEQKRKSDKSAWVAPLVLLVVVAGVPFFKGGGSLAAAVLPGLAAIAPDAVNLAIQNNPQWPPLERLELIGMAAAINKTPTAALTAFGFQQNTAESLWFIPVYWAETLGSRDWQVKILADLIAKKVNQPSAQD